MFGISYIKSQTCIWVPCARNNMIPCPIQLINDIISMTNMYLDMNEILRNSGLQSMICLVDICVTNNPGMACLDKFLDMTITYLYTELA